MRSIDAVIRESCLSLGLTPPATVVRLSAKELYPEDFRAEMKRLRADARSRRVVIGDDAALERRASRNVFAQRESR